MPKSTANYLQKTEFFKIFLYQPSMKKCMFKGMALLTMGFAFVACSHESVYNENAANESVTNEYKAAFEQKYGKVDPNQSWDFTNTSSQAKTRGNEAYTNKYEYPINLHKTHASNDKEYIHSVNYNKAEDNTGYKIWNPNLSVQLWPTFSHATPDTDPGVNYSYYHLGVVYNGVEEDITANINTKYNFWYDITGYNNLNHNSGRTVNTKSASGLYWVAYPTAPNTNQAGKTFNNQVKAALTTPGNKYTINDYKEVKVNGRTYWCFDCNADGIYSDVICLVIDADPLPVWKRYMIEDLGSVGDFDFNDIVVDVIQDKNNDQKAIVRAMGGTLDFTLNIGSTEPWTKSGAGFNVGTMYNTKPTPKWDEELAVFDVKGWIPSENNITVTVKNKENSNVIITIPFPKKGEVPMIIAVIPPLYDWMLERVSLPDDWYTIPEDEPVTE